MKLRGHKPPRERVRGRVGLSGRWSSESCRVPSKLPYLVWCSFSLSSRLGFDKPRFSSNDEHACAYSFRWDSMECLPSRHAKNRTRSYCFTILLVSFMMQLPCRLEITPDGFVGVAHNLPNEVHA